MRASRVGQCIQMKIVGRACFKESRTVAGHNEGHLTPQQKKHDVQFVKFRSSVTYYCCLCCRELKRGQGTGADYQDWMRTGRNGHNGFKKNTMIGSIDIDGMQLTLYRVNAVASLFDNPQ